jgi:hypothetical protein
MTSPTSTITQPPNLTETISVAWRKERRDVPGLTVAPGLAVTPSHDHNGDPINNRYVLTHILSGLAVATGRCVDHVYEVLALAVASGIDWTVGKDALTAEVLRPLGQQLISTANCMYERCPSDPPLPPSWSVRCNTCDWEWEDEYDEGLPDAKAAKRLADDHECEPSVEIKAPGSDSWHATWVVNNDGTILGNESGSLRERAGVSL